MSVTVVYKCVSLALDFVITSLTLSAREDVPSVGQLWNQRIPNLEESSLIFHIVQKNSIKQPMSVDYPRSRVPCSFKDILKKKESNTQMINLKMLLLIFLVSLEAISLKFMKK